jgi:DNA-binding MurR/RpiR family transcriptional regulator
MQLQMFYGKMEHLTPTQNHLIKYISDNYDEVIFLTASRLAQKAGVSEATVVRLSQSLGFDGYPAMLQELRKHMQDRLTTVTRLKQVVNLDRKEEDVLIRVIQEDIRNLSETLRDFPTDNFNEAVNDFEQARRIFVAGFRGAHAPSLTLVHYLRFIGKDAYLLLPGYGDIWDVIYGYQFNPTDLVIGISVPRYAKLTVEIIAYAHQQGAKIGAITDSVFSPLGSHAHWVLPFRSRLDSFIESLTAAMTIVNALLTAISVRDPGKTIKELSNRESLWKSKQIYTEYKLDLHEERKIQNGSDNKV